MTAARTTDAGQLVADLEARLRPLEVALAEAWWDSSTNVSPEADERRTAIELELRALLADADAFAAVCAARSSADEATDTLVRRQLDVLHDQFVPHQVPEALRRRLVELEVSVESTFNTFRGEIDGQRVDDNAILEVLRTSDDSAERRTAWDASKQVGAEVAAKVCELAEVRNEAARSVGFRDHFALALATSELDEARLFATLDAVDRHSAAPFAEWKATLDARLAERFGVRADAIQAWHYDNPFFQDPPSDGAVNLDSLFVGADLEALTMRTYDGLGIDVRPVLQGSDLYARERKSQHAFCIDIDREGDVRVLCNVEPNERWADTMLHEFGHAIYDREVDRSLPWFLRGAAHALTTEGVAMMFGRLVRDREWLTTVAGIDPAEVDALAPRLAEAHRAALLTFARWVLVMTNFERGLYADPGADHETRWWDLVERFQLVPRPVGWDGTAWASKIHLTVAPVYYQNYLYGELVASQLGAHLRAVAGGLVDRSTVGTRLVDAFFRPGMALRWDHLIEQATGAPLSPDALARELVAPGT
jgi:peptidyl-dipeptidase A